MVIDLVVAAITLISGIISFLRGFIREVLTIAGVVAGFFAAVFFGPTLAPLFDKWLGVNDSAIENGQEVKKLFDIIPMNIVADVCAYATVFIIVVIIISVISHFTSGAAKAMGLGPVDRTLGFIFGLVRGLLLLSLLYLPFHLLMDQEAKTKYFGDSKTHYYIEKTSKFIAQYLPSSDEVQNKVDNATDQAEETIKDKLLENSILPGEEGRIEENTPDVKPETGYEQQDRGELEDLFERPSITE